MVAGVLPEQPLVADPDQSLTQILSIHARAGAREKTRMKMKEATRKPDSNHRTVVPMVPARLECSR